MTTNSPPGSKKRAYGETDADFTAHTADDQHDDSHDSSLLLTSAAATSAFRNVSACNRCRVRKNRCDQRLPACTPCEKAKQKCVGYDPITKREIPRSYVFFLESRLSYLESLLVQNNVRFKSAEAFDPEASIGDGSLKSSAKGKKVALHEGSRLAASEEQRDADESARAEKEKDTDELDNLVSNIGMVSVQGAGGDRRYLGLGSGISFARVVLAAVKSSVPEKGGNRSGKLLSNAALSSANSMRDSVFGLQTKPSFKQADFPHPELAEKLVDLYFEHANPQIPILHRVDFKRLFDKAYAKDPSSRTPRELYFLNIVFAIGAGIIWGSSDRETDSPTQGQRGTSHFAKKAKMEGQQQQPEEYHASAIVHLEAVLGSGASAGRSSGPGGSLEELQAVLLLASFALLRPVAPGLWYIIGVAVRLAVDLGLHYEDSQKSEATGELGSTTTWQQHVGNGSANDVTKPRPIDSREKGRREWVKDLRRRLWWCVYSFDRLVSTCVGRPIGITDHVITTEFPSLLDDACISRTGFTPDADEERPSYKRVSYHYFRLRLLQSEILQVLQHQQAQYVRSLGADRRNKYMLTNLPSPFLLKYDSFWSWRRDVDRRLWEWKESAPRQHETGVQFLPDFLELNYWQAVVMLYRNSLTVPMPFANELSPNDEVGSPSFASVDEREDDDEVFLKVAEAGQNVLRLYRQLHRRRLVNYTYLATHHLFMAGIAFLYAVWHSPAVRRNLTLVDVDYTVLAATSVLKDLMEKCPPAEACKDAFERMSKATVHMCLQTTGFGADSPEQPPPPPPPPQQQPLPQSHPNHSRQSLSVPGLHAYPSLESDSQAISAITTPEYQTQSQQQPKQQSHRPPPRFDPNLRDLFPEGFSNTLPLTSASLQTSSLNTNDPNALRQRNKTLQWQQQQSMSPPQRKQTGSFATGNPSPPLPGSTPSSQLSGSQQQYFYPTPNAASSSTPTVTNNNSNYSGLSSNDNINANNNAMDLDLSNAGFDPNMDPLLYGSGDDFGMDLGGMGGIDWGFTGGGLAANANYGSLGSNNTANPATGGNVGGGRAGSLGGSNNSPNSGSYTPGQSWGDAGGTVMNDGSGFGGGLDLFDGFFFQRGQ